MHQAVLRYGLVQRIEAEGEGQTNTIQLARITSKISNLIKLAVRLTLGI
jgi:hypothetical protein